MKTKTDNKQDEVSNPSAVSELSSSDLLALREAIDAIEDAAYRVQDWSGTQLENAIDNAKRLVGSYVDYDDILNDANAKPTGEPLDLGGPHGEGYEG